MSSFHFNPAERLALYAAVLPAFVHRGLQTLPPRGREGEAKEMPGRFDFCAAAWAKSTVDSLEYQIRSDQEYHEKKARESGGAP